MTEKLPNIDAPQQSKTVEVAPLPKSAELLIKLNTLNFPDTQKNVLQSIISSRELEFKGTVRQNTVDVLYKNIQRLDNIASITTLPEQRAFLEEIKQQLNSVGSQHSQWGEYKKAQNEPGMESQRIVAGFFKGLIATGIAIKGLIDIKNGQQGLGALEAGLAAYILRVDKWLDPMNFLAKEVKFLQGQEWKNLKPKNVSQADWASLCGKIIQSNGAKTSSFDENQKQTWEKLTNAQRNRLETLLLSVKTDSGKQTVTAYLNGQSIRSTPTPKYSVAPRVISTENIEPQNPTLAPALPIATAASIANPRTDSSDPTSTRAPVMPIDTNTVNGRQTNDGMIPMRERFSPDYVPPVEPRQIASTNLAAPATRPLETKEPLKDYNMDTNEYNLNPKKEIQLIYADGKENDALRLCREMGLSVTENNGKFREIRCTSSSNIQDSTLLRLAYSELFESIQPVHSTDTPKPKERFKNYSLNANEYNRNLLKEITLHYEKNQEQAAIALCEKLGIKISKHFQKYNEIRGNFTGTMNEQTLNELAESGIFQLIAPETMSMSDMNKLSREEHNISKTEEANIITTIQRSDLYVIRTPNEKTNMSDKLYVSSKNMSFAEIYKAPHDYFGIIEFTMYKLPNTNTIIYKYAIPDSAGVTHEIETEDINDIIKASKQLVKENQRRA